MLSTRLTRQGPVEENGLQPADVPVPQPGEGQLLVRVLANGACRTDLHIIEGDLPLHQSPVTPGHQIVGVVDAVGEGVSRFDVGDRVGAGWLNSTCGNCASAFQSSLCARR